MSLPAATAAQADASRGFAEIVATLAVTGVGAGVLAELRRRRAYGRERPPEDTSSPGYRANRR